MMNLCRNDDGLKISAAAFLRVTFVQLQMHDFGTVGPHLQINVPITDLKL